jgi:hypothetical protein
MRKIVLTSLFLASCIISSAQVRYDVEPVVETIQTDYIKAWSKIKETNGYRIQIAAFTGVNSRNIAESKSYEFQTVFPEVRTYISFQEPYFRVRVGDYFSKLEAYKALVEIQTVYPNAYIIPDKIKYLDE